MLVQEFIKIRNIRLEYIIKKMNEYLVNKEEKNVNCELQSKIFASEI
jgi:hypothetical protein